ncbi:glucose-6-phosphate exchanger SLC37A2-like isoform X2 [Pollicipes pollicipes]|uniref:glucose-6-phosphate exchanger SLC37A2-like isoform X2 n=1 Tax=Pollicipes pollicipes TaxID=41117 RepID=UPI001885385E|nr:glucose-6-phosphate exchanger SLC37A2-like isoform X2 [Pollicipes pollicipes]
MSNLPCGMLLLEKMGWLPRPYSTMRNASFKWLVFVLTFLTYTSYHASRKPISVVKNVLNMNCTAKDPAYYINTTAHPHWCDWKPFDGEDSNTLLGFLDSSYLFSYAFFMFFSGLLAERMDLRYFLSLGMLMSAVFVWLFGAAYYWNVHSLAFFIIIQVACGIFEASGWPGVVTVMGNWNGKSKRGLIFGIWNSHTSVGNILGSLMASAFVDYNWGLSFIVPSAFIAGCGVLNFLFLTPYPTEAGCDPPPAPEPSLLEESVTSAPGSPRAAHVAVHAGPTPADSSDDQSELDPSPKAELTVNGDVVAPRQEDKAISFFQAILIPGVLPFSICLFFAKLVSYTFLYWLPRYLHTAADYSPSESANLSTLFDVGGIVGGILAGFFNDWTGAPGIVCVILLLIAIPVMFVYQAVATVSHGLNTFMLLVVGLLVNGPYALITTAVSADLGTSLQGNSKALATVTAIIDGTGSVGAGLGPLLAGAVSSGDNWTGVFVILMCADAVAILSLGWVLKHEVLAILDRRRQRRDALPA